MVRGDTIEFENDIPLNIMQKIPVFLQRKRWKSKLSWKKCYIAKLSGNHS